jgi:hypothetical protein
MTDTPTPTGGDPVSLAVGRSAASLRREAERLRAEAARYTQLAADMQADAEIAEAELAELDAFLDDRIPGRAR